MQNSNKKQIRILSANLALAVHVALHGVRDVHHVFTVFYHFILVRQKTFKNMIGYFIMMIRILSHLTSNLGLPIQSVQAVMSASTMPTSRSTRPIVNCGSGRSGSSVIRLLENNREAGGQAFGTSLIDF